MFSGEDPGGLLWRRTGSIWVVFDNTMLGSIWYLRCYLVIWRFHMDANGCPPCSRFNPSEDSFSLVDCGICSVLLCSQLFRVVIFLII